MDSFAITESLAAEERQDDTDGFSNKLSEETNKFQRAIAAWRGRSESRFRLNSAQKV